MAFNGDEGSFISMEEGVEMTTQYREASYSSNICVFFGKAMLNELLAQNDAQGLRFYFALNQDNKLTLVTIAADSEGRDIQAKVGNRGPICPSSCCTDSPLSGNVA